MTAAAYQIAMIYTYLEDHDRAFTWLERSYGERETSMVVLNVDPRMEALRSDPRFHDLVQRIGFPSPSG